MINSTNDEMLCSMCQFLALTEGQKLAFLPPIRGNVTYVYNECGDQTANPLFYYCNAILELTERFRGPRAGGFSELIADINCVVGIMIEQHKKYPWIWYLNKSEYPITGPADRVWSVLHRFAEQALAVRRWPKAFPTIPFSETSRAGTRQVAPGGT